MKEELDKLVSRINKNLNSPEECSGHHAPDNEA